MSDSSANVLVLLTISIVCRVIHGPTHASVVAVRCHIEGHMVHSAVHHRSLGVLFEPAAFLQTLAEADNRLFVAEDSLLGVDSLYLVRQARPLVRQRSSDEVDRNCLCVVEVPGTAEDLAVWLVLAGHPEPDIRRGKECYTSCLAHTAACCHGDLRLHFRTGPKCRHRHNPRSSPLVVATNADSRHARIPAAMVHRMSSLHAAAAEAADPSRRHEAAAVGCSKGAAAAHSWRTGRMTW